MDLASWPDGALALASTPDDDAVAFDDCDPVLRASLVHRLVNEAILCVPHTEVSRFGPAKPT